VEQKDVCEKVHKENDQHGLKESPSHGKLWQTDQPVGGAGERKDGGKTRLLEEGLKKHDQTKKITKGKHPIRV